MQGLEHVVRDARTDHLQEHRRRHRQAEGEHRFVRLLDGVAVLERVHQHSRHAREDAVHDEGRCVLDEYAALLQPLDDVPRGCDLLVGRVGRAHDLDERQHRDRVEEVQADVGAHLLDRERRRVRREDRIRRDLANLGEDRPLHVEFLEDRFEHEVAAGELLPAGAAVDDRREKRLACADLFPNRRERLVDARLLEIAQHDRHLEPPQEQCRELRRHQAGADDADLLHRARLCIGKVRRLLRAPLDDGERIRRGPRLRADEQLGHRTLLRCVALRERPVLRARDQVQRDIRRTCRAVHGVVDARPRFANDRVELRPVRLDALELAELAREAERLVDELDRCDQAVGDPELERLGRGQQLVLAQRVQHDHPRRGFGADQLRQQLRAAPGRDDRERDLGKADVADVRRECARGAMQRELETAAERRAVDRGDGRKRQRANAAEQSVPGANAVERVLRRADLCELVDVGSDAEDERLAGEDGRAPVAVLELVEHRDRGLERGAAERRRLAVVLAVVDRDERNRAGAIQLEACRSYPFSQRIAQPMPMPMQSAVRP